MRYDSIELGLTHFTRMRIDEIWRRYVRRCLMDALALTRPLGMPSVGRGSATLGSALGFEVAAEADFQSAILRLKRRRGTHCGGEENAETLFDN